MVSWNLVNKLWFLLIFISVGIALWFTIIAGRGIWNYHKLDAKTPCKVTSWDIEEKNSSKFVIYAHYEYLVDNHVFKGETTFAGPYYLNRMSAETGIHQLKDFSWEVWYRSKYPEESSLQKIFPFKNCLYALLTIGVCIYFLILRYFTFSKRMLNNDL